jgi:hypothetical protein
MPREADDGEYAAEDEAPLSTATGTAVLGF